MWEEGGKYLMLLLIFFFITFFFFFFPTLSNLQNIGLEKIAVFNISTI